MLISTRPDSFKEDYLRLKTQYKYDYEIASELFICEKTLYRWKKAVGILKERREFGIMNASELNLAKRISDVLGMELKEVKTTEFIKLMCRMVDKLERERDGKGKRVSSDIRRVDDVSHVDLDTVKRMGMSFTSYQEMSKRTMPEAGEEAIANYGLGLAGESGEVVDLIKKVIFHGHLMNKEELKKELGDVLHYLTGLCTLYGLSLEEVATGNLVKLKRRYPDGFSVEASKGRVEYGYFNGKPITKEQHKANCKMSINIDER